VADLRAVVIRDIYEGPIHGQILEDKHRLDGDGRVASRRRQKANASTTIQEKQKSAHETLIQIKLPIGPPRSRICLRISGAQALEDPQIEPVSWGFMLSRRDPDPLSPAGAPAPVFVPPTETPPSSAVRQAVICAVFGKGGAAPPRPATDGALWTRWLKDRLVPAQRPRDVSTSPRPLSQCKSAWLMFSKGHRPLAEAGYPRRALRRAARAATSEPWPCVPFSSRPGVQRPDTQWWPGSGVLVMVRRSSIVSPAKVMLVWSLRVMVVPAPFCEAWRRALAISLGP